MKITINSLLVPLWVESPATVSGRTTNMYLTTMTLADVNNCMYILSRK